MRTKQQIMKIRKESRFKAKTQTITSAIISAGIFGVLGFVGLSLSSVNTFAETFEAEQGLSFTFRPAVAISITGGTGSGSDGLTIDDLAPGSYKDSNIITVTASSNNALGYTLSSSVGSSTYDSTELRRNGTETANIFTSLTTVKASLSNFDPGTWGYSYSTNGGTSWISGDIVSGTSSGYNGLPIYTTTTPIKLINSSSASSSSIQFKIGAKATSSQTTGAYTNIINFIGVGKVITTTYTINYNTNGGSTISSQSGTTDNGAVQIPATNVPTKQDYIFKGWCTVDNSSDPTTCTGTNAEIIQPGNFLPLNTSSASITKTLYAVWKDNSSTLEMQNLDPSKCTTTATTVVDNRDNEEYLIQRLADGNCWMLDNLRLGGSSAMNLTPSNTNIASNWTLPASGTTCFVSGTCTGSDGTTTGTGYTVAAINADSKNTTVTSYGTGSGKVGNYYNYCAASGGTYCYASGSGTGDAQYDICPASWRMPTGGSSGEYQVLYTAYSSDATSFRNALSTPLSGNFYNGWEENQGSLGIFWSSTYYGGSNMYRLYVYPSKVLPASNGDRYTGTSLRCVMDKTMQDVGSWESQVGTGEETTAVDKRDGEKYTIARLSDGNLWMTQNLRFQGTELKVGESDVTSDITMTYGSLTSGNSYTEPRIATGSTTDYGTYYNYCAASAGEVCSNSVKKDATRSVCPAGWKLPTRAQLNALPQKESHFIASSGLAGWYDGGSLYDADTNGNWWASTANSAVTQYNLNSNSDFDDWDVLSFGKYLGYSVRCVRSS